MNHFHTRILYLPILEKNNNNNSIFIMNISDNIRLIQWNCYGIRGKLPQLQIVANEVDIMCIQESMQWTHNNFWLKGFKIVRKDIASSNQRGICT